MNSSQLENIYLTRAMAYVITITCCAGMTTMTTAWMFPSFLAQDLSASLVFRATHPPPPSRISHSLWWGNTRKQYTLDDNNTSLFLFSALFHLVLLSYLSLVLLPFPSFLFLLSPCLSSFTPPVPLFISAPPAYVSPPTLFPPHPLPPAPFISLPFSPSPFSPSPCRALPPSK